MMSKKKPEKNPGGISECIGIRMYGRNDANWRCPSAFKSKLKCLDSHTR